MLLSDDVPLRSSTEINEFRDGAWIPWVFGDLSKSPQALVQLSDTLFIYADGAAKVLGVQIDGQETLGFDWRVEPDRTGKTVTFIELAAPLPTGAQITATGYGYVSERNGALIENPADVLEKIFALSRFTPNMRMIAGLARLRSECAAEGLVIGGRISSRETLRAKINEIMRSIGGGWCTENFWLHPSDEVFTPPPPTMESRLLEGRVASIVAKSQSAFSRVAIEFDDQSYSAKNRQALTLAVRPSYDDQGVTVRLLAPWLRTERAAIAVAKRYLRRGSGRVFEIVIEESLVDEPLRIGDVFATKSPRFPEPGLQWLTVIAAPRVGRRSALTCEMVLPIANQAFDIVSRTTASGATQLPAFEISSEGNSHTLTVYDQSNKPVKNARVSIDGAPALLSNAQGKVTFTAGRGVHVAYVELPGKLPVEMPFELS
ncbi:MAG: hypothetical protein ACRCWJ_01760 [Casimicrobium sp.]